MGTLKIELDIPEFQKELNLEITIKRDGEVLTTSLSPDSSVEIDIPVETKKQKAKTSSGTTAKVKGNLMGMDI